MFRKTLWQILSVRKKSFVRKIPYPHFWWYLELRNPIWQNLAFSISVELLSMNLQGLPKFSVNSKDYPQSKTNHSCLPRIIPANVSLLSFLSPDSNDRRQIPHSLSLRILCEIFFSVYCCQPTGQAGSSRTLSASKSLATFDLFTLFIHFSCLFPVRKSLCLAVCYCCKAYRRNST